MRQKLNPCPDGVSRTLPADGGGGVSPLLSAKLLDQFSIRKRYLIAPSLNFPNMLQKFICEVNDDVTGRVKGIFFLSLLASPGKAVVLN